MYHLKCVKAWLVDTNVDNRIGLKHVYRRRLRRQSRIEFLLPLFHEIGLGKFYVRLIMILAKIVSKNSHTFLTSISVTVERRKIRHSIPGYLPIPVEISVKSNCPVAIFVMNVIIQVAVLLVLELSPSLAHAVRRDELYVVVCNTLSPPRVAVIFPASNTLSVAIISVR